jgi:predicted Zn-dependent peptidase
MSQRGIDFANDWVSENVNATAFAAEGEHHPETAAAVQQMLEDAEKEGVSREEIEEDMGDLEDFIDNAFDEAATAEVHRLADKDD